MLIELIAKSMKNSLNGFDLALQEVNCSLDNCNYEEFNIVSSNKDSILVNDKVIVIIRKLFALDKLDEMQRTFLKFLSLISTGTINKDLLFILLKDCFDTTNMKYVDCINALKSYSLLKYSNKDNLINIHTCIRMAANYIEIDNNVLRTFIDNMIAYYEQNENDKRALNHLYAGILSGLVNQNYAIASIVSLVKLNKIAKYLFEDGYYLEASKLLMKPILTGNESQNDIYEYYILLGDVYINLGQRDDALSQYQFAFNSIEDKEHQTDCLTKKANALRKDGDYRTAIKLFNDDIEKIKSEDYEGVDNFTIAELYNAYGILLLNLEQNNEARKQYEEGLKFFNLALNDKDKSAEEILKIREKIAYSLHNIGTADHKLRKYQSAKENHEKACKIRLENDLTRDISESYAWIGNDYIFLAEEQTNKKQRKEYFDKAFENIERGYKEKLLHHSKDSTSAAWSYSSYGDYYRVQGDFGNALENYNKCLDIRNKQFADSKDLHKYIGEVEKLIGLTYCEMFKSSRKKSEQDKSLTHLKKAEKIYSEYNERMKEFGIDMNDSLDELRRLIVELEKK